MRVFMSNPILMVQYKISLQSLMYSEVGLLKVTGSWEFYLHSSVCKSTDEFMAKSAGRRLGLVGGESLGA